MRAGHRLRAIAIGILCLAAQGAAAVAPGQRLQDALAELSATGLRLIFSSELIDPAFIVNVTPGEGSPQEVARRILAPYGLTLNPIRPGLFAVIKQGEDATAVQRTPSPGAGERLMGPVPEIKVYASRYQIDARPPVATSEFTREDLNVLPGIDEDVLRVARYLPGMASNALSARAHVRGGRDNELAVLFDGVPLYEPFHFKDVQGLLGILDPQSISAVDFYSGVFPTRFGNRLSGVLDIRPRAYDGEDYNSVGASLLYTHVLSEGRLDSYPVEWLVSLRRGNADLLATALDRDGTAPDFVDTLARLKWTLSDRTALIFGGMLLDDGLDIAFDDQRASIKSRDATGWITWQLLPGQDRRELHATLSRTERHTLRQGDVARAGSAQGTLDDTRFFDTTTARFEGAAQACDNLRLSGGLEGYYYDAHYRYSSMLILEPLLAAAFGRPSQLSRAERLSVSGEAYGAYASVLWYLTARITLDLGARFDGERFGTAFSANQVTPRASLQFARDRHTVLRLSVGRFAQTQRPDELAVQDGDLMFHPAQLGEQRVASLERQVSPHLQLRLEAFDKQLRHVAPSYENVLDPFTLLPELAVDRVTLSPTTARTFGAELSARWQLPPAWQGWANYSWSQARDRIGGDDVPRTWDQKHSLTVGLTWTHARWGISGNTIWHTGWQSNALQLLPGGLVQLTPLNSSPWPDYLTFDLRTTWTRPLPRGSLQAFLEVDNVANRDNLCCNDYRASGSAGDVALSRELSGWLPRLFLLGVNWQLP